ncbi:MAG: hypothetical protein R3250_17240 [Melioribacteraceae bacterium]|nr:hypothetical protein [Melioribacteraceae bacterium]
MNEWYIGSDYAGINGSNVEFYYGYETTMQVGDSEEWCFVAKVDGEEKMVVPSSKLNEGRPAWKSIDEFNCEECLIAGVSLFLRDHKVV